ncbi:MAG: hypothetical protein HFG75_03890 [Hungatella sp.]|nr:hypothetical protein [Hungatella sp.]
MGLSYNDLILLRFIQKRERTLLSTVAFQFGKNEISIRRAIEQINLYSESPLIEIKKSHCICRLSYSDYVDFARHISMKDYASSWLERIRVMIVAIFFHGCVNASALYEQWGFSLTTKKQDTAHLRQFLKDYKLTLQTVKTKGLTIVGDELMLRFLVIDILHPLLEFTAENQIEARFANTPLENQTYALAEPYLLPVSPQAVEHLESFLAHHSLSINYPSKKFLLLFFCIMIIRPVTKDMTFSSHLPLAPMNLYFSDSSPVNWFCNVAVSMMNFSRSLDFPVDYRLWYTTEDFVEHVIASLPQPFFIRDDFILELYNYFYREITLAHFHCTFVDKTVENTRGQFPGLYQTIEKYAVLFKAAYNFNFAEEHTSTLTLLIQKHILRNQTITGEHKKVVIVTSINFERVSFFLEQIHDKINLKWTGTLNINEIHRLKSMDYDYIFCFSTRIYNLLHGKNFPVIKINFFVTPSEIEHLLSLGFTTLKHRFHTTSFVLALAGKSQEEMIRYLTCEYGDYFV